MRPPPVSDISTKRNGIKVWLKTKLPPSSVAMEQKLQQLLENIQKQFDLLGEQQLKREDRISSESNEQNEILKKYMQQLAARLDNLEKRQNSELAVLKAELESLNNVLANNQLSAIQKIEQNEKNILRVMHRRSDRLEEIDNRYTPRSDISFEVALAEHCNLRCAGCDHFSPIAEPEFADIKEFERDFSRLSELFNGQAQEIHLLGGEPLLNPDIVLFLQVARKSFPQAIIDITTNGLLLKQMSEEFWTVCRDNKIVIRPTKYPVNLDYDALETLAAEHNVEYQYFGNTNTTIKTLNKYPLDINGLQDARRSFRLCHRANNCIYLQHGRLYTCTVAPTIRHLNKKFGLNLIERSEDSIDIYSAKSAREILEFLAKPIPFCRYCMPEKVQNGLVWRQSEGKLSEWV